MATHDKTSRKDSEFWHSMSDKARIKALRKTGSHQDDYKMPLAKMGGSQQDATTNYVFNARQKKKEAMAKKMKPKKETKYKIGNKKADKFGFRINKN